MLSLVVISYYTHVIRYLLEELNTTAFSITFNDIGFSLSLSVLMQDVGPLLSSNETSMVWTVECLVMILIIDEGWLVVGSCGGV